MSERYEARAVDVEVISPIASGCAKFEGAPASALACLWEGLSLRLNRWRTDWITVIDQADPVADVASLLTAPARSDYEIFEAFAVALLSGNTRWDRIARIRRELNQPFQDFDPFRFSRLSDEHIAGHVLPWFHERKAGAANLHSALVRLRATATILSRHASTAFSAHAYLRDAAAASDGTAEGLAIALGSSKEWKLPGFGVALAAEALRLLGLDLCKPDRHILRAVAAWGLVEYRRWDRRGEFTAPQANTIELRETMLAVRAVAAANHLGVSQANSIIWTAGSISGARLTNREFEAIRHRC